MEKTRIGMDSFNKNDRVGVQIQNEQVPSKENDTLYRKHNDSQHAADLPPHDQEHSRGGIFGEKTELIFAIICGTLLGIGFGLSFIMAYQNMFTLVSISVPISLEVSTQPGKR